MNESDPIEPPWADEALTQQVRAALHAHLGPKAPPSPEDLVPPDVAQRLHARLAVETSAPDGGELTPVTTLPVGTHRPIPASRWYAAAATVAVLAAGTTFVVANRHHSSTAGDTAASGVAPEASVPNTAKAQKLPAASITRSNVTLASVDDLVTHVRALVAGASADAALPHSASVSPPLTESVTGGLTRCLATLDAEHTPLAVDEANYLGKDSLVVVYPGGNDREVGVYIVGSACGGVGPDGLRTYRIVTVPAKS